MVHYSVEEIIILVLIIGCIFVWLMYFVTIFLNLVVIAVLCAIGVTSQGYILDYQRKSQN